MVGGASAQSKKRMSPLGILINAQKPQLSSSDQSCTPVINTLFSFVNALAKAHEDLKKSPHVCVRVCVYVQNRYTHTGLVAGTKLRLGVINDSFD